MPFADDEDARRIEPFAAPPSRHIRAMARLRGQGPRWELIEQLFALHCRRLALDARAEADVARRPRVTQDELFGGA